VPFDLLIWKDELQFGALLLVIGYAWWRGAGPERVCGGALLYMALVDYPYHWIFDRSAILASVDLGHAFIDLSTAAIFFLVAIKANRLYPLWLAALQTISFLGHIGRDLSAAINGMAYAILIAAPSYLEIMTLALGVLFHQRRMMLFGTYRSWRSYSPHS
jgi:branched-subunit amino acid transport protein AzlD